MIAGFPKMKLAWGGGKSHKQSHGSHKKSHSTKKRNSNRRNSKRNS